MTGNILAFAEGPRGLFSRRTTSRRTGGRDAGDQAGLRSATGTENTGSRERQEKDDGASAEQSAVAESHAYHRRLRNQQSRPGPRDQWEGRAVLRQEYEAKIRS